MIRTAGGEYDMNMNTIRHLAYRIRIWPALAMSILGGRKGDAISDLSVLSLPRPAPSNFTSFGFVYPTARTVPALPPTLTGQCSPRARRSRARGGENGRAEGGDAALHEEVDTPLDALMGVRVDFASASTRRTSLVLCGCGHGGGAPLLGAAFILFAGTGSGAKGVGDCGSGQARKRRAYVYRASAGRLRPGLVKLRGLRKTHVCLTPALVLRVCRAAKASGGRTFMLYAYRVTPVLRLKSLPSFPSLLVVGAGDECLVLTALTWP
ncbi:hypothetical protein B0H19DRAFT_1085164 [Mycena capillaripes]|nr:hypothetical protein B0H19DRAFT_1085164 [Mycena capillaripes]